MFICCMIIVTIVAWISQNALHEMAHFLVAKYHFNVKLKTFRIFPHFLGKDGEVYYLPFTLKKPEGARFLFARVEWEGGESESAAKMRQVLAAPLVASFALILLLLIAESLTGFSFFYSPFYLTSGINIVWWIWGMKFGSKFSDGKRYLSL